MLAVAIFCRRNIPNRHIQDTGISMAANTFFWSQNDGVFNILLIITLTNL